MYKIIFKGQIPDELVETVEGMGLANDWENNQLPTRVKINGNLYESSAIKAVISGFHNQENASGPALDIAAMWKEQNKNRDRLLALSPEQRAQNTNLAELTYTAITDSKMPDALKPEIIARQIAFFKENSNFAEAKPSCYRDLIPKPAQPKDYHISNFTKTSGLKLVERILQNGIR